MSDAPVGVRPQTRSNGCWPPRQLCRKDARRCSPDVPHILLLKHDKPNWIKSHKNLNQPNIPDVNTWFKHSAFRAPVGSTTYVNSLIFHHHITPADFYILLTIKLYFVRIKQFKQRKWAFFQANVNILALLLTAVPIVSSLYQRLTWVKY